MTSSAAVERRQRQILETLKEAARALSGPSLLLAALFQDTEPDALLDAAVRRFRCISWDVLRMCSDIITEGAILAEAGPGDRALYDLSEACRLSMCDFFWSHSWSDDGNLKWAAISTWCEQFRETHSRAPKLWLDKVCIDQADILSDLQCLPIFLAGCSELVVTSGVTYTSRLWCCVELFVYVAMLVDDEARGLPHVLILASGDADKSAIEMKWAAFDAGECKCSNPEDRVRMMKVIEQNPGGVTEFNVFVRTLCRQLFNLEERTGRESINVHSFLPVGNDAYDWQTIEL